MPISRRTGVDIFYEKSGSGPPLVLIHAIPFDHNMWVYQIARFSAHYTVIAVDLRALGRSGKPDRPVSLRELGSDVMGVLGEEGITNNAIVMGCSVGSKIALLLACDHPDVFKACIAVGGTSERQDTFGPRIKAYLDQQAAGTVHAYLHDHLRHGVTRAWADTAIGSYLIDGFIQRHRERHSQFDARALVHLFGALSQSDLTDKLAVSTVPTLVINGEHDSALKAGRRTVELFPRIGHRILPGVGHCCMLEDPAGFDRLVIDFLIDNGLWTGDPA